MKINYEQHTPREALALYCDWLSFMQEGRDFFPIYEKTRNVMEWYMVFYPLRTLLMGAKILGKAEYSQIAESYVDKYLTEQLPNGGFTSTYRRQPTSGMSKADLHNVYIHQNVNVADNGSNVLGLVQAAGQASANKREEYLAAARKWFDDYLPIWILPAGGFNNGLWVGELTQGPYTCAISTGAAALSAFAAETNEDEYAKVAERAISFQMEDWFDDGRPVNYDPYNSTERIALNDYGHSFYLLEGMVWTHFASKNADFKRRVEERLKLWFFGEKGLLSQWWNSWFNYMVMAVPWDEGPNDPMTSRRHSVRLGWELAKSNGILHGFIYYLNNIEDNKDLRETVEKGIKYLSHPLKCRMSGVMSDVDETYGAFAVQSTGFAGLSLAEYISPGIVFGK